MMEMQGTREQRGEAPNTVWEVERLEAFKRK